MATTTVEEPKLQAVPPKKTRAPGAGRPPKPVPPPPSADAGSFWQWLDEIPKDDWQNLICYVWRTGPVIDLSNGGKPITIDKIAQPFDQAYMYKTHGSGSYRFDICYSTPDGKERKRIRQAYETLVNLDYPPRLGMGEWIDDPRNKNWEWCKPGLIAEDAKRSQDAADKLTGAKNGQSKTEELSELLDLVSKLKPADGGNANTALLLELIKMNDPSKAFTLAKEIAGMAPQPAAPQNPDNGFMGMFLKFLMEERKDLMAARTATADPIETATKLLTGAKGLFEGMGLALPAAAAANPGKVDTATAVISTVGDIVSKAVDQFGPYVPQILGVIQHVKDRELQIAQVAAARNMNPTRPWEYAGPAAAPAAAPTPAPAPTPINRPVTTQPPAPAPPGPMTPQTLFAKYQAMLNRNFQILQDKFQHEDGYAMQDHLLDREGRNNFLEFRADASVELLMGLVNSHPQLKQIFSPEEKARQFFTELLEEPPAATDNNEDEEEANDEGGPSNG